MKYQPLSRRDFIQKSTILGAGLYGLPHLQATPSGKFAAAPICIFSKHLQFLPDYNSMAEMAAEIGFDGVDLTVRPGGHVLPEEVEQNLPLAVKAVTTAGLSVPMMTTRITSTTSPNAEMILQMAQEAGINAYRMGYLSYDMEKGIVASLEALQPQMDALAQLNQKYELHGAYQNHDGLRVGAAIWDIWQLVNSLDPTYMGIQYDIRHATVEGGRSWELDLNLIQSHVKTLVIKDFKWTQDEGGKWRETNTPLGEGMVNFSRYFELIKQYDLLGPISLHFEYDWFEEEDSMEDKKLKTIAVMKRDLKTLKQLLEAADLAR